MDKSKQMNAWIRQQAGHGPAVDAATEAKPKPVTANAGSGANGPFPDVETSSQKVSRYIRKLAGRFV